MSDGPVVLFLSDEWVSAADASVAQLEPVPGDVTVAVMVTGGPEGERCHRLVLGPTRVGVDRDAGPASVTMTMDWELAVAVNQGRESAQRAFLDGRLTISGDPVVLLGHQAQLAGVDDVLGHLRARTTY